MVGSLRFASRLCGLVIGVSLALPTALALLPEPAAGKGPRSWLLARTCAVGSEGRYSSAAERFGYVAETSPSLVQGTIVLGCFNLRSGQPLQVAAERASRRSGGIACTYFTAGPLLGEDACRSDQGSSTPATGSGGVRITMIAATRRTGVVVLGEAAAGATEVVVRWDLGAEPIVSRAELLPVSVELAEAVGATRSHHLFAARAPLGDLADDRRARALCRGLEVHGLNAAGRPIGSDDLDAAEIRPMIAAPGVVSGLRPFCARRGFRRQTGLPTPQIRRMRASLADIRESFSWIVEALPSD